MARVVRDGDIENGMPSDAIGCARYFHLTNGDHLRAQLLTEGDRTFIDWWAKFEVFAAAEPKVVDQVKNGSFRRAFQAIAKHLKSPAPIRVPYLQPRMPP
jgi:hypothetical protein